MDVTHNDWEDDKHSDAKRFRVRILRVTLSTVSLRDCFKCALKKVQTQLFSAFIFFCFYLLLIFKFPF